jgi:hypothetical protein
MIELILSRNGKLRYSVTDSFTCAISTSEFVAEVGNFIFDFVLFENAVVGARGVVVLQVLLINDIVLEAKIHQTFLPLVKVDLFGGSLTHESVEVGVILVGWVVLWPHDSTQSLENLLSRAFVDVELYCHVGVWKVNGFITNT